MKKIFLIAAAVVLAGCSATGHSSYVTSMDKYKGVSEKELIAALGPPDQSYEMEGSKYLTYTKSEQYANNPNPVYGVGGGLGGGVYGGNGVFINQSFGSGQIQTWRCDVFFIIRNKRVDNIGHRGNSC